MVGSRERLGSYAEDPIEKPSQGLDDSGEVTIKPPPDYDELKRLTAEDGYTPPVDSPCDLPTPLMEVTPSLVRRSLNSQIEIECKTEDEVQRVLLLIENDSSFDNVKNLAIMFEKLDIFVQPFFVAIAKYNDMKKEKGNSLSDGEINGLCVYVLRILARAFLFEFGDEGAGSENEAVKQFVVSRLQPCRDTRRGGYFCNPAVLDELNIISIFARAQLNGNDTQCHFNDLVFVGLLPES